jgi:hypothetical protein
MADNLLQWATMFESQGLFDNGLAAHITDLFVWGTDPYESFHPDVLLNHNHLLGILVCRIAPPIDNITLSNRLQVMDTHPRDMTLKQVKDTLANLQFEWPHFLDRHSKESPDTLSDKVAAVRLYLQAITHRLGFLLGHLHPPHILDDIQDTSDEGVDLKRITTSAIRRLMAAVLVLNRHLDLYDLSEEHTSIPPNATFTPEVTPYHHEASMERFYKLHMYWTLPAGARMQYKHDFPGMFNDISQVAYFHNPDYKRIKRDEYDSPSPLHLLPSICLLYPEVEVRFEDDFFNPQNPREPDAAKWYWILLPQRIYLVSPEPKVYFSHDLNVLLWIYLSRRDAPRS